MKRGYIFAALVSGAVLFTAGCAQTEKTEGITARITAAQMQGRNAAKLFIPKRLKTGDDIASPLEVIDTVHARYVSSGLSECAEAFDSTLVRTLKVVRPDLAPTVERHMSER